MMSSATSGRQRTHPLEMTAVPAHAQDPSLLPDLLAGA